MISVTPPGPTDNKYLIDLFGQLLVFATLLFAIIRYLGEKKRDFRKRFFEEQLAIFTEAVDYASVISAHGKQHDKYKDAVFNFKRLYWGKMCLVEDILVESDMVGFYNCLNSYDKNDNDSTGDEEKMMELQGLALKLAHQCHDSSMHTWGIKYGMEKFKDYLLDYKEMAAARGVKVLTK